MLPKFSFSFSGNPTCGAQALTSLDTSFISIILSPTRRAQALTMLVSLLTYFICLLQVSLTSFLFLSFVVLSTALISCTRNLPRFSPTHFVSYKQNILIIVSTNSYPLFSLSVPMIQIANLISSHISLLPLSHAILYILI